MYHQTELFQSLFIFFGCIILAFGIGFYTFNNKLTQRKREVEELEPIRFKVSKIYFSIYAGYIFSPIGITIGASFIFRALEATNIFFLIYILLLFMSVGASILLAWSTPLCFLTDKHIYVYPYFGLSSKCKKYELKKLQWKEDSLRFYLYDGDKNLRCSFLSIYRMKEQKAIMEFIRNTSPRKEEG